MKDFTFLALLCFISSSLFSQLFNINSSEEIKLKGESLFFPELVQDEQNYYLPSYNKYGQFSKSLQINKILKDNLDYSNIPVELPKRSLNITVTAMKNEYSLILAEPSQDKIASKEFNLYSISTKGELNKKFKLLSLSQKLSSYSYPIIRKSHDGTKVLFAVVERATQNKILHITVFDNAFNQIFSNSLELPIEDKKSRFRDFALTNNGNILYVEFLAISANDDSYYADNLAKNDLTEHKFIIKDSGTVLEKLKPTIVDKYVTTNEFSRTEDGYTFITELNKSILSKGVSDFYVEYFSAEDGNITESKNIAFEPNQYFKLSQASLKKETKKVPKGKNKKQTVNIESPKSGFKNRGISTINGKRYIALERYSLEGPSIKLTTGPTLINKISGDMVFLEEKETDGEIFVHKKLHSNNQSYKRDTKYFEFDGVFQFKGKDGLITIYNDNIDEILGKAKQDAPHLKVSSLSKAGTTASKFIDGQTSYSLILGEDKKDFLIVPRKCIQLDEETFLYISKKRSTGAFQYKIGIASLMN